MDVNETHITLDKDQLALRVFIYREGEPLQPIGTIEATVSAVTNELAELYFTDAISARTTKLAL